MLHHEIPPVLIADRHRDLRYRAKPRPRPQAPRGVGDGVGNHPSWPQGGRAAAGPATLWRVSQGLSGGPPRPALPRTPWSSLWPKPGRPQRSPGRAGQRQRIQERGDQAHGGGPARHRAQHHHQRPVGRRRGHHRRHPHLARRRGRDRRRRHHRRPVASPGAKVPLEFTGLNRIPILLPASPGNHEAFVPLVGGDRIGQRPVDFHIGALEALGAEIEVTPEDQRPGDTAAGAPITLPYPASAPPRACCSPRCSPTGARCCAMRPSEPEVTELALFLQRMGARIGFKPTGASSSRASPSCGAPEPACRATGWRRSPTWWPGS